MQTGLPRALAALGVALLLSSIEAEGKMLLLLLWQIETAEFKKGKDSLASVAWSVFSARPPVLSLLQRNACLLRCVRF